MNPLFQNHQRWPTVGVYEVVVIGAGPAGIGAAVAASKLGLKTLVVEKYGFPGGTGTISCTPHFMGFFAEGEQIIGGVADDLVRELDQMGEAQFQRELDNPKPIGERPLLDDIVTSVAGVRVAANRLLEEAEVDRMYYTSMIGVVTEGTQVKSIAVDREEGLGLIYGDTFVDATGDANLVYRAGGEVREYSKEHSMTKTLNIHVGGVKDFNRSKVEEKFKKLVENGEIPFKGQDRFMGWPHPKHEGEVHLNFTLTTGNGLLSSELTCMDIELRKQVLRAVEWFRERIPGFNDCFLVDSAVRVGVRAGRGIVGVDTLTKEQIDENNPVEEPILLCTRSYGGHYMTAFRPPWHTSQSGIYSIPWKTLLPTSFSNVTVGGRAISCDVRVMDTFRLMSRCMGLGQAAGVTAALATKHDQGVKEVSYEQVRENLIQQNALLAEESVVKS